jgi:trehalose 6-phosphate phosphatase
MPQPSRDWALFLDFDGTLVDIAATPAAVRLPVELPDILDRLRDTLDGAVALISGRPLNDLDHFLGDLNLPAAGQHGAEMRSASGEVRSLAPRAGIAARFPEIALFVAARPGLYLENKGLSIALHYRLAPQYQEEVAEFLKGLVADPDSGLEMIGGHCVFELRPRGVNKGAAVRRFLDEAPFIGRVPVFVGDDKTDEDGFRVAMERGGCAIKVGLDGGTLAETRVSSPSEVRQWLSDVAESLAVPSSWG